MVLRLPDDWVWDSWLADDGEVFHLFFLKARRALGDPDLRHGAATVGHAVSTDLRQWELRPDALVPASATAWDDRAIWTGSVAEGDDGVWRLYYTALSTVDGDVNGQRLGLAESDDLQTWHRVGALPLLEADPRWYRTVGPGHRTSETWRDPFVFRDPGGDGWHMLITARAADGPPLGDAVLGHARSHDMRTWETGPPLTEPAGFGHYEVPQVEVVDGQPVLVFSCLAHDMIAARRPAQPDVGTWSVLGETVLGPWDMATARPFDEPSLYAARLVRSRDDGWVVLGFRDLDGGVFQGEIVDPIPVGLDDGALRHRR
jgi:beta-fructofuranosidase